MVDVPARKATYTEHRYNIMTYLGFQKFDDQAQAQLEAMIEHEAQRGMLPDALFQHRLRVLQTGLTSCSIGRNLNSPVRINLLHMRPAHDAYHRQKTRQHAHPCTIV